MSKSRGSCVMVLVIACAWGGIGGPSKSADAAIDEARRLCFDATSAQPGDLAVVNLTPVNASSAGNGQLVSSDTADPRAASNVNYAPGTIDPNLAFAPVGADGTVCFRNSDHARVDLVADLLAVLAHNTYVPNPPDGAQVRIADTRIGVGGGRIAAGERRCFASRATPGTLAVVNLTPVLASAPGYGVLTSSSVDQAPTASNVNFAPGTIDPNVAVTPVGADGRVCFHNSDGGAVDLVADLQISLDAAVIAVTSGLPIRLVDTRPARRDTFNCPTDTRCYAAGDQFYISDDSGSTWRLSDYAAADLDRHPELRSITCLSRDVCTFSGSRQPLRSGTKVGYVTVDGGRIWRTAADVTLISDVSCPSDTICIAVGALWGWNSPVPVPTQETRTAAVTTDRGRTWRNIGLPPLPNVNINTRLTDVACVSSSECTAIAVTVGSSEGTTILRFTSDDDWSTVTVTEV